MNYDWFKRHPLATLVIGATAALTILAIASISSFGTPAGW